MLYGTHSSASTRPSDPISTSNLRRVAAAPPPPRRRPTAKATAALDTAVRIVDAELERSRRSGGSWHRRGSVEQRAAVRMWAGRAAWCDDLADWAASGDAVDARSAAHGSRGVQRVIAVETLTAVGLYLAAIAGGDGRDVAVANRTIAASLQLGLRTVERARATLRKGGFEVVIVRGGYLTAVERTTAREAHGGRQLRCASNASLTHPPNRAVGGLPRRGSERSSSPASKMLAKRGSAAARRKNPSTSKPRQPVAFTTKQLAAQCIRRWHALDPSWTGRGHIGQVWRVIGRLEPAMRQLGIPVDTDPAAAAADLFACLDAGLKRRGLIGGTFENPLGQFFAAARQALAEAAAEGWVAPSVRSRADQAAWRARAATARQQLDALDAERARLAADPETEAAYQAFRASLPPKLPTRPRRSFLP